jgi:ethanolamine utilization protein EutQ (cupin superfamily)
VAIRIAAPTIIAPVGNKPKQIAEYVGRVNSSTAALSVAHMKSPSGWVEPGQTPEFDEYTLVLKGSLRVETHAETLEVPAGQAVIAPKGEWVRYSTPGEEGAEYVAICLPAFSPSTVHRDEP